MKVLMIFLQRETNVFQIRVKMVEIVMMTRIITNVLVSEVILGITVKVWTKLATIL